MLNLVYQLPFLPNGFPVFLENVPVSGVEQARNSAENSNERRYGKTGDDYDSYAWRGPATGTRETRWRPGNPNRTVLALFDMTR